MKALVAEIIVLTGLMIGRASAQIANNNVINNGSGAAFFARVDPTGLSGTGTGIQAVTVTNLAQNTTTIAQNFFAGGGVDPQPSRPAPQNAALRVAPAALAANPAVKRLMDYHNQLLAERLRLAQQIGAQPRDSQLSALKMARLIAIQRTIESAERQFAVWGVKGQAAAGTTGEPARQGLAEGARP